MKLVTAEFKSGGLHEKHVVATWMLGTISAFAFRRRETNNYNSNNNNIYLLQLGCHPVAVVILHVNKT